jgi:hypothetical protein
MFQQETFSDQQCILITQTNKLRRFSPQVNYIDWETAGGRRILMSTLADTGMSYGERGGPRRQLISVF